MASIDPAVEAAHVEELTRLWHDTACKWLTPDHAYVIARDRHWAELTAGRVAAIRDRIHVTGQRVYDRAGVQMKFFGEMTDEILEAFAKG